MEKRLSFSKLQKLYLKKNFSVPEIAKKLKCSEHKINYWISKYKIKKRTISEAIYLKNNPNGDPFKLNYPKNSDESELFGLGIGLYWGEGNKKNKHTVKIGNSDPELMEVFIKFLIKFFNIKKKDLRFHLHIFTDVNLNNARNYWIKKLKIKESQFYKSTVTKTGKLGTYKNKSEHGVLTLYYNNVKLRNILVNMCLGSSVGRARHW